MIPCIWRHDLIDSTISGVHIYGCRLRMALRLWNLFGRYAALLFHLFGRVMDSGRRMCKITSHNDSVPIAIQNVSQSTTK
jgi:hypothetical protein